MEHINLDVVVVWNRSVIYTGDPTISTCMVKSVGLSSVIKWAIISKFNESYDGVGRSGGL